MRVEDLDTPALTIDLDILLKNIRDLAESCSKHEIALRVHTKTHKIPEIARLQLEAGAIGIVCQKLGEAEVMVHAGITDILIPYNIVGARKVERLVRLRERATITVALDSETTARGISEQAGRPENTHSDRTGYRRAPMRRPVARSRTGPGAQSRCAARPPLPGHHDLSQPAGRRNPFCRARGHCWRATVFR